MTKRILKNLPKAGIAFVICCMLVVIFVIFSIPTRAFNQIAADNLVAYYPFDYNLNDYSNKSRNGTCSGANCPTIVLGNKGNGVYFDGLNDFISLPEISEISGANEITIAYWINLTNGGTVLSKTGLYDCTIWPRSTPYDGHINSRIDATNVSLMSGYDWGLQRQSGPTPRPPQTITASLTNSINNNWHHVTQVYNGSAPIQEKYKVYIDGNLINNTQGTMPNTFANFDSQVVLGRMDNYAWSWSGTEGNCWNSPTDYLNGIIDELRIYNKALNATEIIEIKNVNSTPQIQPIQNQAIAFNNAFSLLITAYDNTGISCFSVNDSRFAINCSGFLKNASSLAAGLYNLNIIVNDTTNDKSTAVFSVNVTKTNTLTNLITSPPSPVVYPAFSNFSCFNNANLPAILYINGINKNSENGINVLRIPGTYSVLCNTTESQNYSSSFQQMNYAILSNSSLAPNMTIISPSNKTYNSSTIVFNITSNSSNVSNCWYSLDNGITNYSLTKHGDYYSAVNSTMKQGISILDYYCNDTFNNIRNEKISFFIDSVFPIIQFVFPTTLTGNYSLNFILANITVDDSTLDTIMVYLYNSTGLVKTNSSKIPFYLNFSNLNDNVYLLIATANDSAGNIVTNEIRNILLDTTAPIIYAVNSSASNDSATIKWNTNELTNSTFYYATGNQSYLSINNLIFKINHSLTIAGLTNNTQYFYYMRACDYANNCNNSSIYNFTTLAINGSSGGNGGGSGGGGNGSGTGNGGGGGGNGKKSSSFEDFLAEFCGNKICESIENEDNCPSDCPEKKLIISDSETENHGINPFTGNAVKSMNKSSLIMIILIFSIILILLFIIILSRRR